MKERIGKNAGNNGQEMQVMWQVNNHFHVTASPGSRLPNGFCLN
jgi:hypothetical protein